MFPAKDPSQLELIGEFERAVYARDYPQAIARLRAALLAVEAGRNSGARFPDCRTSVRVHTRFAAAITALLAAPDFELDFPAYLELTTLRRDLALVFTASGFGDGRHLRALSGKRRADGSLAYSTASDLMKMLLGLDLASGEALIAEALGKVELQKSIPAMLGLLRQRQVLTPKEEASRTRLLELAPAALDAGELPAQWVHFSLSVWMYCSYAASPRKHEVKAALNRAYRRHLAVVGIGDRRLPTPRQKVKRPTLLVMAEIFHTGHAMHRCYAAVLAQAARRFRTLLMGKRQDVDDAACAPFDAVISASHDVRSNVREIERIAPDLIYYPSVGMRSWAVLLANLRLAPIQLMSIGHPASSFSPVIDYLLLGRDVASEAAEVSERVIVIHNPRGQLIPHTNDPRVPPRIRERAVPLRIAIPAKTMKLNAAFLAACRRIEREAKRPIEFHFFPNDSGTHFRAVENVLCSLLPRATVYPATDYPTYMRRLNDCDIALSPFPFGSGNSAVDAVLQAVPVVAMEGHEPHARTERRILRAVGQPDWLTSRDAESYVAAALRLCRDDAERVQLSRSLLGARERLFVDDPREHPGVFEETLSWLYEHHEAIQASPRRFWWPEDRALLTAAKG